jgi:uncharacterized spore protein YtfJ
MDVTSVSEMVEQLRQRASVEAVFGDPIERDGRTVVPVARVAYGFGGGWGTGDADGIDSSDEARTEDDTTDLEGGGFGGGLSTRPVGALEIAEDSTRFVRFDGRRSTLGAFAFGVGVGVGLGALARTRARGRRRDRTDEETVTVAVEGSNED